MSATKLDRAGQSRTPLDTSACIASVSETAPNQVINGHLTTETQAKPSFRAVRRKNGQRVKGVYERAGVLYARVKDPVTAHWRWVRSPDQSIDGAARIVREAQAAVGQERAASFAAALDGSKVRRQWPTVQQVLEAYEVAAKRERAVSEKPRESTERDAKNALRQILREQAADKETLLVDALPALARKWCERKIEEGANRHSVATTLRAAHSVFARWSIRSMEAAGVKLPLELSRNWPTVSATTDDHQSAPEPLRKATVEAGRKLLDEHKDLGLAFALCYYCGMARADAVRAQWDWIKDGRMVYRRQKTRKPADPPIQADVLALLASWPGRDEREHILPGFPTDREDMIDRTLSKWMVALGWTTQKKAHELRKMICSHWRTHCGLNWAARWIGDSEATAAKYYADLFPESAPTPPPSK